MSQPTSAKGRINTLRSKARKKVGCTRAPDCLKTLARHEQVRSLPSLGTFEDWGPKHRDSKVMSDRELMILGKLVLTFGCLLGLPIWELWKLKRDRSDPAQASGEEESETGHQRAPVRCVSDVERLAEPQRCRAATRK